MEHNVSFPHLRGRFVVELRTPVNPCRPLFRIGLMVDARLDLLHLKLIADVLGLHGEIRDG